MCNISNFKLFCVSLAILGVLPSMASTGRKKNITVYRITPRNYTGLTNFDTADARGDVFFGIYELAIPELCQGHDTSRLPQCRNVPILSIPGFNVYGEFILEYEDRFGDYNECNPDPDTGIFSCEHHTSHECWYDNENYVRDFSDECEKSQCTCDYIESVAVGREPLPFGTHVPIPSSWPAVCKSSFQPLYKGYTFSDRPSKTLTGSSLEDCCQACDEEKGKFFGCHAWSFDSDDSTCNLFAYPRRYAKSGKNVTTAYLTSSQGLFGLIGEFANIMNGTWYSTQKNGECKEGQEVGKDCAWRLVEQTRNVNSTCVNDNVVNALIQRNATCFNNCGPDKNNKKSSCWINCVFNIISGVDQINPPMTAEEIVKPFSLSFESDDPSKGGCPTIPPCPTPCKPPQF